MDNKLTLIPNNANLLNSVDDYYLLKSLYTTSLEATN